MCSEIRSIIFSCQLEGVCVLKKGVYILLPVRGGMCSEKGVHILLPVRKCKN